MELVLNLLWVLLAIVSFIAWRKHAYAGPRTKMLTSLLALGCVLVLMFPVISVTDDLHYSELAAEDAASSRKVLQALHIEKATTQAVHLDTSALVAVPVHPPLSRVLELVIPNNHTGSSILLSLTLPDRAPPVLFA